MKTCLMRRNQFENCILKCNHEFGKFIIVDQGTCHTHIPAAWAIQVEEYSSERVILAGRKN